MNIQSVTRGQNADPEKFPPKVQGLSALQPFSSLYASIYTENSSRSINCLGGNTKPEILPATFIEHEEGM